MNHLGNHMKFPTTISRFAFIREFIWLNVQILMYSLVAALAIAAPQARRTGHKFISPNHWVTMKWISKHNKHPKLCSLRSGTTGAQKPALKFTRIFGKGPHLNHIEVKLTHHRSCFLFESPLMVATLFVKVMKIAVPSIKEAKRWGRISKI